MPAAKTSPEPKPTEETTEEEVQVPELPTSRACPACNRRGPYGLPCAYCGCP